MKHRSWPLLLAGAVILSFLSACAPNNSVTDPTGTTTVADIATTTTCSSSVADATTVIQGKESTADKTAAKPTQDCVRPALPQEQFQSIEKYRKFMETADRAMLEELFTVKSQDGTETFIETEFDVLLKEQSYLLPILPNEYQFKTITLTARQPMRIQYYYQGNDYVVTCYLSKTEKQQGLMEQDAFTKNDGTQVAVYYDPNTDLVPDTGYCFWDEYGYQCVVYFTQANKEQVWDLVKAFEMKIVPIK